MSKIRFGVNIDEAPEILKWADYDAIKDMVIQCEALDYYSLWVQDHLTWGKGLNGEGGEGNVFEAWTLLSALSAVTSKMKLGVMVTCNSFRHPSLMAKMATTLDVISNGRLIFGYGAGWKQDEYEAYGFPFHKASVRLKQMREAIIVIHKLWVDERASFQGTYYTVTKAPCYPKPMQKPHPPIMIGGGGEKLTLKIAAELADGWNLYGASVETYKRKVDILTKYCDEYGKRIEEIELSWAGNLILAEDKRRLNKKIARYLKENRIYATDHKGIVSTYDDCVEKLQTYIDIGCTHFVFLLQTFNEDKESFIEKIAPSF